MRCTCPLMTQSGHHTSSSGRVEAIRCFVLSLGGGDAAARFRIIDWRLSGRLAVGCARAATRADATCRRVGEPLRRPLSFLSSMSQKGMILPLGTEKVVARLGSREHSNCQNEVRSLLHPARVGVALRGRAAVGPGCRPGQPVARLHTRLH